MSTINRRCFLYHAIFLQVLNQFGMGNGGFIMAFNNSHQVLYVFKKLLEDCYRQNNGNYLSGFVDDVLG